MRFFYDKLKFIYIELPKFKKSQDELETQFDKWLYVFRHLSRLQNRPQKLQDRIFEKLFEAAEIARFSPVEKEAYEKGLQYYRDIKNIVDTSREKGMEQRTWEIARKMKPDHEPMDKIIRYMGLSKEDIEKL